MKMRHHFMECLIHSTSWNWQQTFASDWARMCAQHWMCHLKQTVPVALLHSENSWLHSHDCQSNPSCTAYRTPAYSSRPALNIMRWNLLKENWETPPLRMRILWAASLHSPSIRPQGEHMWPFWCNGDMVTILLSCNSIIGTELEVEEGVFKDISVSLRHAELPLSKLCLWFFYPVVV